MNKFESAFLGFLLGIFLAFGTEFFKDLFKIQDNKRKRAQRLMDNLIDYLGDFISKVELSYNFNEDKEIVMIEYYFPLKHHRTLHRLKGLGQNEFVAKAEKLIDSIMKLQSYFVFYNDTEREKDLYLVEEEKLEESIQLYERIIEDYKFLSELNVYIKS